MKISTVFEDYQEIPEKYTCLGLNINFPITVSAVPPETKSFTLIFEDLDATPMPWTHWLVFNIPVTTLDMKENQIPAGGTEGLANNHSFGYEGPCPKFFKGVHHYRLRLYAVDCMLSLPPHSEKEVVREAMDGHVIETAGITGNCTAPE